MDIEQIQQGISNMIIPQISTDNDLMSEQEIYNIEQEESTVEIPVYPYYTLFDLIKKLPNPINSFNLPISYELIIALLLCEVDGIEFNPQTKKYCISDSDRIRSNAYLIEEDGLIKFHPVFLEYYYDNYEHYRYHYNYEVREKYAKCLRFVRYYTVLASECTEEVYNTFKNTEYLLPF